MDASSAASAVHRPGRGRVFDSIVDAIGDTPIVRLRKSAAGSTAQTRPFSPSWNISIPRQA